MHERFHALATSAAGGTPPTASPPSTTERTGVRGGRRLLAPWSSSPGAPPPAPARDPEAPTSVWSGTRPAAGPVPAVAPPPGPSPDDAPLLALLLAPARPGETAMQAFARKELELRTWFEPLTPVEALALQRRLSTPLPADPVALAFGRLVIERRHRLLAFLGDARRRAALHATRRAA